MTVDDLVKFFGTPIKAARAAGYSHTIIYMWRIRGKIPIGAQCRYQVLTNGILTADLSSN